MVFKSKIIWNTYRCDYFVNDIPICIFPNKLIEKSGGEIIINEHSKTVLPVSDFPEVVVINHTRIK